MHKIKYAFKDIARQGNKRMCMFKVFKPHKTFKCMNDYIVETGSLPMIMLRVHTGQKIGGAI